jgi:hypothetical protein
VVNPRRDAIRRLRRGVAIACPIAFGLGLLGSAVFHLHPVWALGLRAAILGFAATIAAVIARYAIDAHLERIPHDGNDRSRVLPATTTRRRRPKH